MRRTAVVLVVLLVVVLAVSSLSAASSGRELRQAAPIGYVAINGRTYGYGDALFCSGQVRALGGGAHDRHDRAQVPGDQDARLCFLARSWPGRMGAE